MFSTASHLRRAAVAGLTVCAAVGGAISAASAHATPDPAVAPAPVGAVLTGSSDLRVSRTTPTTVRISNTGLRSAGTFAVVVSKGAIGECDVTVPAVTKRFSGLTSGASVSFTIDASSYDRVATVDYLNEMSEASEINNSAIAAYTTVVC